METSKTEVIIIGAGPTGLSLAQTRPAAAQAVVNSRRARPENYAEGLGQAMDKDLDKAFYEIQVKGELDAWWAELFDGMSIASHDHVTTISGFVADQAALHGLLAKVRDFGLVLLSVKADEGEKEFS